MGGGQFRTHCIAPHEESVTVFSWKPTHWKGPAKGYDGPAINSRIDSWVR